MIRASWMGAPACRAWARSRMGVSMAHCPGSPVCISRAIRAFGRGRAAGRWRPVRCCLGCAGVVSQWQCGWRPLHSPEADQSAVAMAIALSTKPRSSHQQGDFRNPHKQQRAPVVTFNPKHPPVANRPDEPLSHDPQRDKLKQKAGPFGAAALQGRGDRGRKERSPPRR